MRDSGGGRIFAGKQRLLPLRYAGGALSAEKGEFEADLCLSEQTLCQLCLGALSMDQARWKQDVILKGENPALWALFPGKKVFLTNGF